MEQTERVKRLLKANGYSVTKPRLAVFNTLLSIHGPISVPSLCAQMKTADKVSIYRTIDLFEKIGILQRVWLGFKAKIELSDLFSPHHHHFVCLKCENATIIDDEDIEKNLHRLESEADFKLIHHSIELSGYCRECR